jgi:hypothetical protein
VLAVRGGGLVRPRRHMTAAGRLSDAHLAHAPAAQADADVMPQPVAFVACVQLGPWGDPGLRWFCSPHRGQWATFVESRRHIGKDLAGNSDWDVFSISPRVFSCGQSRVLFFFSLRGK